MSGFVANPFTSHGVRRRLLHYLREPNKYKSILDLTSLQASCCHTSVFGVSGINGFIHTCIKNLKNREEEKKSAVVPPKGGVKPKPKPKLKAEMVVRRGVEILKLDPKPKRSSSSVKGGAVKVKQPKR